MKGTGEGETFFVFWLLPLQAGVRFLMFESVCVCVCLKKRAGTVSGVLVSLWKSYGTIKQASLTAARNK